MEPNRREVASNAASSIVDPLAPNYGDVHYEALQSMWLSFQVWTTVSCLTDELKEHTVLLRGWFQTIRPMSKKMAFLTVRENGCTVQGVLTAQATDVLVSEDMIKYATSITKESFVEIEGVVMVSRHAIKDASQPLQEIWAIPATPLAATPGITRDNWRSV